jgi:Bacterial Ig-like domain (group 3)
MLRSASVMAAAAVVVAAVVAPASVEAAGTSQPTVVNTVPATYTPDVNNGVVFAIGQVGSTVFIGGSFTSVSQHASATTFAAPGIAAFTAGTGALVHGFAPKISGTVNAIAAGPTAGTVYVAGDITSIDGVQTNIALLNASTGAMAAGWKSPTVNGGEVTTLGLGQGQLFAGGEFSVVNDVARHGLVTLNPVSGAVTAYSTLSFAGHHNFGRLCIPTSTVLCASGGVGVRALDINPAGTRMIVIGNFTTVSGAARDQIALIDLGASSAAADPAWATDAFTAPCASQNFDTTPHDVQFSPDGSYFVVVSTGGLGGANSDGTKPTCDSAERFETNGTGSDVRPTWSAYDGRDSLWSVAVTGTAIYVGGHERWFNNSNGNNMAAEGAVPRPGIAALDPVNGMPLKWNPGRNPRGAGAYALLATSSGLYIGSDQDWIGDFAYHHKKIAFLPLAGGETLPANTIGSLPGDIFLLGSGTSTSTARELEWDGSSAPTTPSVSSAVNWSAARGAFEVNNQVYYGSTDGHFYQRSFNGATFGAAVSIDPYDDPVWDTVPDGTGGFYQGAKSNFYSQMSSLTSMFYSAGRVFYTLSGKPQMFWRWFEPDSGVMGADQFTTTDGLNWSHVAGAFLSGSTLYFADSTSKHLFSVAFTGGHASGTPTVAETSLNWTSRGAFVMSVGTRTSLKVSPAGPVLQHQSVRLTATVSAVPGATVGLAGTVTFKDGSVTVGEATVNATTGSAVLTTSDLPPSAPDGAVLTASFSSAAGIVGSSSSSPAVTYTVNPVASVPTIAGVPQVGVTNTCSAVTVTGENVSYAWTLNGKQVAIGPSYRSPAATHGKRLACTATVSIDSGPTSVATSKATKVALGAALRAVRRPKLSGRHRVGATEVVSLGTWSPKATSYSYQWFLGTKKIRRANKSSLRLISSERGLRVRCRVTSHLSGYTHGTAMSNWVKVGRRARR